MNAVPSYFSLIIAKLNPSVNILDINKQSNGRKDIYNLMCCNSAMKNVFFDNDFTRLVLNFLYVGGFQGMSAVDKFQKNLSNSEYYALLNRNDDKWINIQWAYKLEPESLKPEKIPYSNSNNFELLTNFVGSRNGIVKKYFIQYINYHAIIGDNYFFVKENMMKKISEMPKIIAFLLLNKINIDPRNKNITVNDMQWMLDNGFLISSGIREQILQTFDLAKLKFLLAVSPKFLTKQATVSKSTSSGRAGAGTGGAFGLFHTEELRMLYMGPPQRGDILSEKDHRNFLTYLYSITNLPFDFFSHEGYIDFSYDIIYSLAPQKFDNFVRNLHYKNIGVLKLIQWAVLHKLKILKADLSKFYYFLNDTFMYLINEGYLPEKETIYEILRSEDFTVLDILKKNGADFSFGTRQRHFPPNIRAWLAKNNS